MEFNRPRTRLQHDEALMRKCRERNGSRGKQCFGSSKFGVFESISKKNDANLDFNGSVRRKDERGMKKNTIKIEEMYDFESSSEENTEGYVRSKSKKIGKKEIGVKRKYDGFEKTGLKKKRRSKSWNVRSIDDASDDDSDGETEKFLDDFEIRDGAKKMRVNDKKKNAGKLSVDFEESDADNDVKILSVSDGLTMNSIFSGSEKEPYANVVLSFDTYQYKRSKSVVSPIQKKGKSCTFINTDEKNVYSTESSEELSESEDNSSSNSGNSSNSLYREEAESLSSDEVVSSDKDDKDCKPDGLFVASHGSSSVGEDEVDEKELKIPFKTVPKKGKFRLEREVAEESTTVGERLRKRCVSESTKKKKMKMKSHILGTSSCPFKLSDDEVDKLFEEEEVGSRDERACDEVRDDLNDVCEESEGGNKGKKKVAEHATKVPNTSMSINKILVDSIWDKGGAELGKLSSSNENPPDEEEILPLKFDGFSDSDEDTIPEKSYWDIEGEKLFEEMDYVQGFDDDLVDTEDNISSKTNKDHASCVDGGNHHLVLDEEIGLRCTVCNFLVQEVGNIIPDFAKHQRERFGARDFYTADCSNIGAIHNEDFTSTQLPNFHPHVLAEGTVWDLVPGMRNSMYPHQREGFEFIWKNIADSIFIDKAKICISDGGGSGCIISHAPGTGKTRLTIMFIQSYMQLNPYCRPLIIAPSHLLHTWEQEFKKWNVGIPFHNLSNPKYSGHESAKAVKNKGDNLETIRLVKLFSWTSEKSVIGISYQLFEELAYNNVLIDCGKKNKKVKDNDVAAQIRKMLLVLPGLLVLDECHIPRNLESQILKALLELQTERRIMLSGTIFQNSFEELFNTFCLARPKFSDQIMSQNRGSNTENRRTIKNAVRVKWASMTKNIGKDGDQKLKELKDMMNAFVHVYEGSILKEKLLGLNEFVVVLSPTNLQKNIMEVIQSRKNSFDLDHLRSLISVHPSLFLSATLSEKEKLNIRRYELEKLRLDPSAGVKTKFVLQLVRLIGPLKERVLVFSQFIDSLKLIMEHLSNHFCWTEGREILYMSGDHSEKQRQLSINLLNDPETEARVLLASSRACSEGINLVGASRVVLIDVLWNPSTTRQSISRAYRLGQKKVVYVYHLLDETWEGTKYTRQAEKGRISDLVFSSKDGVDKTENSCSISEDKVLQDMVQHPSMSSIFSKILNQPNELDLIDTFDRCRN